MAEFIVPSDGDVTVHCFLPSGSVLELQFFFRQGEDAREVVLRELAKEGLSSSHMPQIMTALTDIFLAERRKVDTHTKIEREGRKTETLKPGRWMKFTEQFASPISRSNLKTLQSDVLSQIEAFQAERRKHIDRSLAEDQGTLVEKEALALLDKEIQKQEKVLVDSFWTRLGEEQQSTSLPMAVPEVSALDYYKKFSLSIGTLKKRQITLSLALSEDMFCTCFPTQPSVSESTMGLDHPENVYTRSISALCLPCSIQDGVVSVLPDLIRKCEESPELHFPSVREQVLLMTTLRKSEELIGFTRHSNIGAVKGAFHLQSQDLLKKLIYYCDQNCVERLVIPLCEWLEDLTSRDTVERFLGHIKHGLLDCTEGELKEIAVMLDSDEKECKEVAEVVSVVFTDEVLPDAIVG